MKDNNLYGKGFYFTEDAGIASEYEKKEAGEFQERKVIKFPLNKFSKDEALVQRNSVISGLSEQEKSDMSSFDNEESGYFSITYIPDENRGKGAEVK